MNSEQTVVHGYHVFHVHRPLYSAKDREQFQQELTRRIAVDPSKHLIVDFSDAGWFGVPILDELIVTSRTLEKTGGELLLIGSPTIDRMLDVACADRVKRFASVRSAVDNSGRPVCAAA